MLACIEFTFRMLLGQWDLILISFDSIVWGIATNRFLIELGSLSTSLCLLLLLGLLGEFANHHVALSEYSVALRDYLVLLELYDFLLM